VPMTDLEELHQRYVRVADFRFFDPSQRICWLYLREATERWLERNEDTLCRKQDL